MRSLAGRDLPVEFTALGWSSTVEPSRIAVCVSPLTADRRPLAGESPGAADRGAVEIQRHRDRQFARAVRRVGNVVDEVDAAGEHLRVEGELAEVPVGLVRRRHRDLVCEVELQLTPRLAVLWP
mgnify:CR=1 FL=1